jgi:hypothetical protein
VVVDLDGLHQTPRYNIYSHLVYATKASDVRTVVVEGRVLMRDRRLLTLNEELIKTKARALRERISRSIAVYRRGQGGTPLAAWENVARRVDTARERGDNGPQNKD